MLGLKKRAMKRMIQICWQKNSSTKTAFKFENWDSAKPFKQIPGPKTYPILGSTLEFIFGEFKNLPQPKVLKKLNAQYGNIVQLHGLFGKDNPVFLFDPADMETVYRTEGAWPWRKDTEILSYYRKHFRQDIYKDCPGVTNSQGKDWHDIRTKVNPVLMRPQMVKQYISPVEDVANEFIARMLKLRDESNEMPDDFWNEMNRWALESMGRIALHTKLGCLSDDLQPDSDPQLLIQSTIEFLELVYQLEVLPSPWKYISTPGYRRIMKVLDTMTDISQRYVERAQWDLLKGGPNRAISGPEGVLGKLLKIDRRVAVIMVMDLLLGGVETVSSTCVLFLYNIARNQEVQDKIRKEIRLVLPEIDSRITTDTLNNIPYLKGCIKESSRITPIIPAIMRKTGKDNVLSGYKVPKGTDVFCCHPVPSLRESQFPSPQEFIPERWMRKARKDNDSSLPSAGDAHPFSHMPFGFGSRMCIGKRFAELEMEVFFLRLLRNYRIEWNYGEIGYKPSLLNTPAGKLKFKMTETN